MIFVSRRAFLASASVVGLVPLAGSGEATQAEAAAPTALPFPSHLAAMAQEIVGASHGNAARVRELLTGRPALARASFDWGFGDWETALGAASHVGNREIAELLLTNGAHPTIFSAAMLGQLDTVKAFVAASPGVQKTRGPHGISLLSHAKAGGTPAAAVVSYLGSLGDADPSYPNEPIDAAAMAELAATYAFGDSGRFIVSVTQGGALMIKREGAFDRRLWHHGSRVFNPAGAEAVRVSFTPATGRASSLKVQDGPVVVTATRT